MCMYKTTNVPKMPITANHHAHTHKSYSYVPNWLLCTKEYLILKYIYLFNAQKIYMNHDVASIFQLLCLLSLLSCHYKHVNWCIKYPLCGHSNICTFSIENQTV